MLIAWIFRAVWLLLAADCLTRHHHKHQAYCHVDIKSKLVDITSICLEQCVSRFCFACHKYKEETWQMECPYGFHVTLLWVVNHEIWVRLWRDLRPDVSQGLLKLTHCLYHLTVPSCTKFLNGCLWVLVHKYDFVDAIIIRLLVIIVLKTIKPLIGWWLQRYRSWANNCPYISES